jgi:quercetin dioxygenase-like cupin family protein
MSDRREFLSALGLATAAAIAPALEAREIQANTLHRQALPEPFSGWEARFVDVQFPAGVASAPHRHPGFVLGYVIEGEFRFALNGDPPRILGRGEVFYEPPGAEHTVGDSASTKRDARVLAIIVAPVEKA